VQAPEKLTDKLTAAKQVATTDDEKAAIDKAIKILGIVDTAAGGSWWWPFSGGKKKTKRSKRSNRRTRRR
jgi:hypothetical protein